MDNKLNIVLVNAHAKSRRGNNNLHLIVDKGILVFDLFTAVHLAVECARNKTILVQFLG